MLLSKACLEGQSFFADTFHFPRPTGLIFWPEREIRESSIAILVYFFFSRESVFVEFKKGSLKKQCLCMRSCQYGLNLVLIACYRLISEGSMPTSTSGRIRHLLGCKRGVGAHASCRQSWSQYQFLSSPENENVFAKHHARSGVSCCGGGLTAPECTAR